jgi:hypothetical protein
MEDQAQRLWSCRSSSFAISQPLSHSRTMTIWWRRHTVILLRGTGKMGTRTDITRQGGGIATGGTTRNRCHRTHFQVSLRFPLVTPIFNESVNAKKCQTAFAFLNSAFDYHRHRPRSMIARQLDSSFALIGQDLSKTMPRDVGTTWDRSRYYHLLNCIHLTS